MASKICPKCHKPLSRLPNRLGHIYSFAHVFAGKPMCDYTRSKEDLGKGRYAVETMNLCSHCTFGGKVVLKEEHNG